MNSTMNNTIEEVKEFFEQCKAFWIRQGNSELIASCKAFWWDIVEVSNAFNIWTPGKEQFAKEFCGYKPHDPEPAAKDVESGNCPHN